MASYALRAALYAEWPNKTPSIRYVQTENRDLPRTPPLPLPDLWGTLGFEAVTRRILTMGKSPWIEEQGQAIFVICARSGHGDQPGVEAASALMRAWDGWRHSGGLMWFQNVGAPRKLSVEAEGEWFLYSVPAEYRVQERPVLP